MLRTLRPCWITLRKKSVVRGHVASTLQLSRSYSPRPEEIKAPKKQYKVVLRDGLTVKTLATKLNVGTATILKLLKSFNEPIPSKQSSLPVDVAELVVLELGHIPELPQLEETDVKRRVIRDDDPNLRPRPPVVTIMGHVDHGKTTLLDTLRKTSVAAEEAGGITQHVGAFEVSLSSGQRVTFLDTPGHAAFTSMRARGTHVTDIVVLVVAADDGVQAQTIESIKLAQDAQVPIVVAINKCDKHDAKPTKVQKDLLQHGVQLEAFAGDVQSVEISALKGTNLPSLIDAILVQSEMMNLRGDPYGPVEGVVIEARKDKGLGPVATVLVQHGTLNRGRYLVSGETWAKVKVMLGERNCQMDSVSLSQPVVLAGWKDVPLMGEDVIEVESEQRAKEVASVRQLVQRRKRRQRQRKAAITSKTGEGTIVPLVVKGDVAGSVEVLESLLNKHQPHEFQFKIISSGVGNVTEADIELAHGTGGMVLGFNVVLPKSYETFARHREVEVLTNRVIYRLLQQLKEHLEHRLPPVEEEEGVGEAIVLKTFTLTGSRKANVVGCRVKSGRLERKCVFRVLRDGETVYEGHLESMKHGRDDISAARKETECGLIFPGNPDVQEDDTVQCFKKKLVPREVTWDLGF